MFPSAVDECISTVDAAIDRLLAIDASELDQDALRRYVVEMHRLQARMEAVSTKSVGAFDRHGDPEGAVGAAAWVSWKCRTKRSQAKAELSRARALRHMPEVDGAYGAGSITGEHVRLLAAAQRS